MKEQDYDQMVKLRIEESRYEYEQRLKKLEEKIESLKKQIR